MASAPAGTPSAGAPHPRRAAARQMALGRVAIGAALLVAPGAVLRPWLGRRAARSAGARVAGRALGVRDMLLGALALHTLSHGRAAERVLAACAVADAVDAAATWTRRDELPGAARAIAALAAGSAVAHAGVVAGLRAA